jgi:hypothetical protein
MKRFVAVAAVVLLGSTGRGDAQGFVNPWGGYPGWGGGYWVRGNFAVSFGGANFNNASITGQVVAVPAPRPLPLYSLYPGGVPPAVVVPPPVLALAPPGVNTGEPIGKQETAKKPANENDFIAIRPGNPAVKAANVPAPAPPPQPIAIPIVMPVDAVADKKADPKTESARQVELAKAAFALDEYGRAEERLAVAINAKPDEPRPYFWLAQVRFARGEYAEAVAAIRDGMAKEPNWPTAMFRPKEFYDRTPERYDAHLAELRRAAAANPDEPAVAFLLGYQLWFTGEPAEAVKLFRKVAKQVKDATIVEQFLSRI